MQDRLLVNSWWNKVLGWCDSVIINACFRIEAHWWTIYHRLITSLERRDKWMWTMSDPSQNNSSINGIIIQLKTKTLPLSRKSTTYNEILIDHAEVASDRGFPIMSLVICGFLLMKIPYGSKQLESTLVKAISGLNWSNKWLIKKCRLVSDTDPITTPT